MRLFNLGLKSYPQAKRYQFSQNMGPNETAYTIEKLSVLAKDADSILLTVANERDAEVARALAKLFLKNKPASKRKKNSSLFHFYHQHQPYTWKMQTLSLPTATPLILSKLFFPHSRGSLAQRAYSLLTIICSHEKKHRAKTKNRIERSF